MSRSGLSQGWGAGIGWVGKKAPPVGTCALPQHGRRAKQGRAAKQGSGMEQGRAEQGSSAAAGQRCRAGQRVQAAAPAEHTSISSCDCCPPTSALTYSSAGNEGRRRQHAGQGTISRKCCPPGKAPATLPITLIFNSSPAGCPHPTAGAEPSTQPPPPLTGVALEQEGHGLAAVGRGSTHHKRREEAAEERVKPLACAEQGATTDHGSHHTRSKETGEKGKQTMSTFLCSRLVPCCCPKDTGKAEAEGAQPQRKQEERRQARWLQ